MLKLKSMQPNQWLWQNIAFSRQWSARVQGCWLHQKGPRAPTHSSTDETTVFQFHMWKSQPIKPDSFPISQHGFSEQNKHKPTTAKKTTKTKPKQTKQNHQNKKALTNQKLKCKWQEIQETFPAVFRKLQILPQRNIHWWCLNIPTREMFG